MKPFVSLRSILLLTFFGAILVGITFFIDQEPAEADCPHTATANWAISMWDSTGCAQAESFGVCVVNRCSTSVDYKCIYSEWRASYAGWTSVSIPYDCYDRCNCASYCNNWIYMKVYLLAKCNDGRYKNRPLGYFNWNSCTSAPVAFTSAPLSWRGGWVTACETPCP